MSAPPIVSLTTYPRAYVTPAALARYLLCDRRTILKMIDAGALTALRVGRAWRIPIEEARRAFPSAEELRGAR